MSFNSFRSNGHGRYNRPRSFSPRNHIPKFFDPSHLVGQAVEQKPQEVFEPKHTFADFELYEQLTKNIEFRGYKNPTAIQDQVIPAILDGLDVVGLANTGTGKTAAFLIPLIHKMVYARTESVLIIAPTRELAMQIEEEFRQFAVGIKLYSALCIGGVGMHGQIQRLRRNPHFVIGTPGRLMDLERRGDLDFGHFTTIVLDEVDQMLDMGFIHDVTHIVESLPKPRHSLFFSATTSPKARQIMDTFLYDPVIISVKTGDTAAQVNQSVIKINGRNKIDVLHELLSKEEFDKVLVFIRTKFGADRIARSIEERGIRAATIHGNKNQSQRRRALEEFKQDRVRVLFATDVAARGLDINNVSHVINFDLPESYDDYIHRIGRTGRADKTGIAITLVD